MLVVSVITMLALASEAWAQRSLALTLYNAGVKAYDKGDYREALRALKQCEDMLATTTHTPAEEAGLLYSLGETQRCMGQIKESEATLKKAMAINDNLPQAYRNDFWLFNAMAGLYNVAGKYPEAEALFKQDEQFARGGKLALYPVNNLCQLYFNWGKIDEAAVYSQKALVLGKRASKTIAMPYSLFNSAQLLEQRGKYKEAEAQYDKAYQSCVKICGENHPYCAQILIREAELMRKQSYFGDAEDLFNSALKIFATHYQPDHPDICETEVKLARVLSDEGKYQQARELAQKALKKEQTLFGDTENMFTAHAKECLGNTYRQDGHYDEAQKLLEQVLNIEHRILGSENIEIATTMRNLAMVQADEANFKEAEKLLEESLTIIERQTGPDHPERAAAANALAHVYLRDGDLESAEPLLKKAQELAQRVLGEDNLVTLAGARDLGELYLKKKNYNEAALYQQDALEIDQALNGETAPQIAADLTTLAATYGLLGQPEKAEPLLKRAAEIKNVLPGGKTEVDIQPQTMSKENDRPVRDKWALVVGISNFKDSSINLKYAAKDATDFKNFLVSSEHFKPDHVKLLTDENASRDNILGMLGDKWLANRVKADDLVLVYVSSHGSSATTEAGGTNFLVAYDTNKNSLMATGIPMQWLVNMIGQQVHSDRIILIMDVCHSGAAGEGQKALTRTVGLDPQAMQFGKGQMVLCSSLAEQVSWESKGYENSVFTRRLMEALQTDKDKTTMLQAYKRLKVLVESEVLQDRGNLQTPLLVNKNWIGSDPVLAAEPQVQ